MNSKVKLLLTDKKSGYLLAFQFFSRDTSSLRIFLMGNLMTKFYRSFGVCLVTALFSHATSFAANKEKASQHLKAEKPIALKGAAGKFDFMQGDPTMNRVLAAHREAKALEIIDSKTSKPLPALEVGHVQGIVDSNQISRI